MFDKQKLILISTKYISYLINIVIIAALAAGVYLWVMSLIQAAR